jgi:hypothetical protein
VAAIPANLRHRERVGRLHQRRQTHKGPSAGS